MQPITLKEGINSNEFPALNHFQIPLTIYHIQSIVRDLAKLNKSTTSNILNFSSFNGAHSSLVHVSCSSNYEQFKRNARRFEWSENMLKVAVKELDVNLAAEWVAQYIWEDYSESFIGAGTNLGLLLQSKVMDTESACAMWEEANVPLQGQRIILRHLANFFGRHLTVPESRIRDLERGAVPPISESAVIDGKTINYWYKPIDEAVMRHLEVEINGRGENFFDQFDSVDIVFGGDHGARKFHAVVRLIFRNKNDASITTLSVVLTVGSIDCAKDSRLILQKTIINLVNDSLGLMSNKFLVAFISNQGNSKFVMHCNEKDKLLSKQLCL
jgi:hypothetical protein